MKKIISVLLMVVIVFSLFTTATSVSAAQKNEYKDFINYRGQDLQNTYAKLQNNQPINVLYMGGSVTEGVGSTDYSQSWRVLVKKWFESNYSNVNNINIAQSGTGTTFGSYRYNEQVAKNNPDLLFVEFSINDKYDGITVEEAKRSFETIIRQTRIKFPTCDIVTVFVTDQPGRDPYTLPRYAKAHDEICEIYDVPSIDVGGVLLRHLKDTNGNWSDYVADTCHPRDAGYIVYANAIKEYLENCLKGSNYSGGVEAHTLPEMYSDSLLDGDIKYIDVTTEMLETSKSSGGSGWYYEATSGYPTQVYGNVLKPSTANCKFVLEFTGTELAMVVFGGSAYINVQGYNVTVDGKKSYVDHGKFQPQVLVTGLTLQKHTVIIEPKFKSGVTPYMMISGFFTRDQTKTTTKSKDVHEHIYGEYISDNNASCLTDGTKTAKCTIENCKTTKTINDVGSKLQHKYMTVLIRPATDDFDGVAERSCSLCGMFDSTIEIPRGSKIEDIVPSDEIELGKDKTNNKADNTDKESVDDVIGESEKSDNKKTDNKKTSQKTDSKKQGVSNVLIIILISVVSLLIIGVGVWILIKKKL